MKIPSPKVMYELAMARSKRIVDRCMSQIKHIERIAERMRTANLHENFITAAAKLARTNQEVMDLMVLWDMLEDHKDLVIPKTQSSFPGTVSPSNATEKQILTLYNIQEAIYEHDSNHIISAEEILSRDIMSKDFFIHEYSMKQTHADCAHLLKKNRKNKEKVLQILKEVIDSGNLIATEYLEYFIGRHRDVELFVEAAHLALSSQSCHDWCYVLAARHLLTLSEYERKDVDFKDCYDNVINQYYRILNQYQDISMSPNAYELLYILPILDCDRGIAKLLHMMEAENIYVPGYNASNNIINVFKTIKWALNKKMVITESVWRKLTFKIISILECKDMNIEITYFALLILGKIAFKYREHIGNVSDYTKRLAKIVVHHNAAEMYVKLVRSNKDIIKYVREEFTNTKSVEDYDNFILTTIESIG